MKKTIHKLFSVWAFEKEEQWLNDMSVKGFQLCAVGLCTYTFEESAHGEYIYRLGVLDKAPSHPDSRAYIQFIEDTGAAHVGTRLCWVYFRKKADVDGFELFSDAQSRLRHFEKLLKWIDLICPGFVMLFFAATLVFTNSFHRNLWFMVFYIAVISLLSYGFIRLLIIRHRLEKESLLRE